MANSWILAGALWGLDIWLCGPEEFKPAKEIEDLCRKSDLPMQWHFTSDCKKAADQADVLYTDVWVSMGCEDEKSERMEKMSPSESLRTYSKSQIKMLYLCIVCLHTREKRLPRKFLHHLDLFYLTKPRIDCICRKQFLNN